MSISKINMATEEIINLEFSIIGLPKTILINKEIKIIYKHLGRIKKSNKSGNKEKNLNLNYLCFDITAL